MPPLSQSFKGVFSFSVLGFKFMKVETYAFPGGYPLFYYVESDDGKFHSCPSCINRNRVGKNVTRCDGYINYEDDSLYCEVCNEEIEAAYGE